MKNNGVEEEKKKKQHYVPQCYLEAWAIKGTHQVHVYDKLKKKPRKNNIKDVASENYFYDINFRKALSRKEQNLLAVSEESLEEISKQQFLENFFADHIEGELSRLLNRLIDKLSNLTPRKLKKHFISRYDKWKFSRHLSFQHIRTKAVRNAIDDVSDCLQQMLKEMNVSSEMVSGMKPTKDSTKLIHAQMISDQEGIANSTRRFNSFVWILAINDTTKEFITSDNPITTRPHVSNPYMSMSGLMSKGVEVFYPISPRIMLIMFDREYHKQIVKWDRHYFVIRDARDIDSYNLLTVIHSTRCVFSSSGDFSIIDKILELEPNVFDRPNVSLSWNGKVFHPKQ